ncbi:hypothetical protein H3221_003000 [Pseudomonas sp. LMG 31766]|jgi:hypothetical protein|uniref:HTH cro/C1-type domain-containing protein n=1 Tax=Pseudomonas chaetocerotis TaxID=2758695 RepID=A0A931D5T2_9PSED|nr:hypothetical protein [Pseudomonas chaetocerotis]MBZ9663712.1 hypothetical protein [Pseudomonas chaetocerotis]
MKLDEVPQDHSSTYGGHSKLVYAVDASGHYQGTQSDGWEPEAYSTLLAVAELEAQEAEAREAWQRGELSPLKCLMYRYRMDESALSQITGLWQWRVRRHFRPNIYRRLSTSLLARYAEAFGLTVDELRRYQRELP